eukprot:Selendium_serpulae@DN1518_c1_g1_i1.p1
MSPLSVAAFSAPTKMAFCVFTLTAIAAIAPLGSFSDQWPQVVLSAGQGTTGEAAVGRGAVSNVKQQRTRPIRPAKGMAPHGGTVRRTSAASEAQRPASTLIDTDFLNWASQLAPLDALDDSNERQAVGVSGQAERTSADRVTDALRDIEARLSQGRRTGAWLDDEAPDARRLQMPPPSHLQRTYSRGGRESHNAYQPAPGERDNAYLAAARDRGTHNAYQPSPADRQVRISGPESVGRGFPAAPGDQRYYDPRVAPDRYRAPQFVAMPEVGQRSNALHSAERWQEPAQRFYVAPQMWRHSDSGWSSPQSEEARRGAAREAAEQSREGEGAQTMGGMGMGMEHFLLPGNHRLVIPVPKKLKPKLGNALGQGGMGGVTQYTASSITRQPPSTTITTEPTTTTTTTEPTT